MATYRCKVCDGLYVSPQDGMNYYHACPPIVDDAVTGRFHERPGHRDENLVQTLPGPEAKGTSPDHKGPAGTVSRRRRGAGRVKLSDDDLLTGADADRLAQLRAQAGRDEPDA